METRDDASRFAWACGVFEIEPGASMQKIRAAILARLEQADFMPPTAWRQALRLLTTPQSQDRQSLLAQPADDYDAFRDAAENQFAELVDEFAVQFFSLPSGPRRLKWTRLQKLVQNFPRLRARLSSLAPGLEIERHTHDRDNPQDAILVERIQGLFVLKPADRIARRRQWLASMQGDWRSAVRRLKMRCPRLVQLESEFLSALLASRHGAAAESTVDTTIKTNLAAAISSGQKAAVGGARRFSSPQSNSRTSSSANFGWARYVVVMIIVSIFRSFSQQPTYQPPQEYYHYPAVAPKKWTPPTQQEIEETEGTKQAEKLVNDYISGQRARAAGKLNRDQDIEETPGSRLGSPTGQASQPAPNQQKQGTTEPGLPIPDTPLPPLIPLPEPIAPGVQPRPTGPVLPRPSGLLNPVIPKAHGDGR